VTDVRNGLDAELRGRYTIEHELGRGGMATVYLARDLRHDRPVALKVLHPELAATLGPERFLREIRLAARLQHPHILTVLDSGAAAGQLWFTMPYVEGETLRDRLRREGQLPLDDALRIARETADALDYAHHHGVIHRDIKPENILLAGRHALVADFGIARALGAGDGSGGPAPTREQRLTETGMSIGTPAYMSPEQASGDREVDARSDVYSLGCVLYEMLAGEPPFTGPTAQAILLRKFTESPRPLRAVRDTVPEAIERAVACALARFPADRFPSAAEFRRVLEPTGEPTAGATVVTPAPQPAVRAAPPRRSLRYPVTLALLGGFVIGLGLLFAWRRGHAPETETASAAAGGAKLVAVLPFENLGGPDDEYFSDGITDEIRGKLSGLSGLQVTARSSSSEYKNTKKRPQEVGRELGVDYLLTGTVRWEKGQGGASRVRVSPELIQVSTGSSKWQQPFDAALTDVFQVQADIAGRVAQALDVALGSDARQRLAERPTKNLDAYDTYLKAEAAFAKGNSPSTLHEAVEYFEHAVVLDSTFVAAWAGLSEASSLLYAIGAPSPAAADEARSAAERALALAPDRPEGYTALGDYYRRVPGKPNQAIEQYNKGIKIAPANADLLRGVGLAEMALGRWDDAEQHFRKGLSLDPRSGTIAGVFAQALYWQRRYPDALAAYERAIELRPSDIGYEEGKAMVHLAQGDLPSAREVLRTPPKDIDMATFVAYVGTYWDLYWALDPAQQALLRGLSPRFFDDDRGTWGLAMAGAWEVAGDVKRARAYADTARVALEQQLKAAPEDPQRHVLLGVTLAYLGRPADAIREGQYGVSLAPVSKDAQSGPYYQHQLARIYILLGEQDKALDQLEALLKIPYYLSPGWLSIDPTFAPLRGNERFRRLAANR
jgi:serine/threonine-protein kinase